MIQRLVRGVAEVNYSGAMRFKNFSVPTVDGPWTREENMNGDEATREAMRQTMADVQRKQDVVTLAKACRGGLMATEIVPLTNGFMVSLRSLQVETPSQNFVFNRADKIGTLVHTLYNSNLDNPKATKRLRKLLGYL